VSDATITTRPIVSTVVAPGRVAATVQTVTTPAAAITGGVGAQGPIGAAGGVLDDLADVTLASPSSGDVLRYASGAWRNYPETNLTDGGHF
jgi:hypothetical protein